MQTTSMFALVNVSKNGVQAYACTFENLRRLGEEWGRESAVAEHFYQAYLAELAGGPALLSVNAFSAVLREVLDANEHDALPLLHDLLHGQDPSALTCRREWQQELVLWAFENRRVLPGNLDGFGMTVNALEAARPFDTLSFLADVRKRFPQGIAFIEDYYLEAVKVAHELRSNAHWAGRESAADVARRHLRFLHQWLGGGWQVVEVRSQFPHAATPLREAGCLDHEEVFA